MRRWWRRLRMSRRTLKHHGTVSPRKVGHRWQEVLGHIRRTPRRRWRQTIQGWVDSSKSGIMCRDWQLSSVSYLNEITDKKFQLFLESAHHNVQSPLHQEHDTNEKSKRSQGECESIRLVPPLGFHCSVRRSWHYHQFSYIVMYPLSTDRIRPPQLLSPP